jgi:hypothetical protein
MGSLLVKRSRALSRTACIFASFLSTISFACGGDDGVTGPPTARFELVRDGVESAFFDLPWPTDLRRGADGIIDVHGFPNPRDNETLQLYIDAVSTHLDGWANNGAIYFRFDARVDPRSLPRTAAESIADSASVFLFDVEAGTRHPAFVLFQDEETRYWPSHTLAIRPIYGIPLGQGRTYAAVVTRELVPWDGGEYSRSADFEALLGTGGDATVEAARAAYGPALDALERAGVARESLLSLAVFTTQDSVSELAAVRDWMVTSYTMPEAVDDGWRWIASNETHTQVEGRYGPVPTMQHGEPPYMEAGTGDFRSADGVPLVYSEFDARFMLTVPTTPMPEAGYPIVLYAHGTGGDYATFTRNDTAAQLALEGYAVIGIDQVLHGERNPTSGGPELLFFNFLNPLAARDNNRQAAIDVVQQARFATSMTVPTRIVSREGTPIRFDPERVYVFGHSQGGLNMPLFLAIDDTAKGGYLSGAGGTLAISIIDKTEPISIALAIQFVLGLPGGSPEAALAMEGMGYEHPVVTLLQTWVEASDGVNYARMIFDTPREGFAPKSLLMTGGQLDEYTVAGANASLAAATRMPIIEPVVAPDEALDVLGIAPVAAPVTGNVAGGAATAGLLQFPYGGHFVAFESPIAMRQISGYFRSLDDGVPTIPAR